MKHTELPRVLRRAVGLMRFAREAVRATDASLFLLDAAGTEPTRRRQRVGLDSHQLRRRGIGGTGPRSLAASRTVRSASLRSAMRRRPSASRFEPRGIVAAVCVPLWES